MPEAIYIKCLPGAHLSFGFSAPASMPGVWALALAWATPPPGLRTKGTEGRWAAGEGAQAPRPTQHTPSAHSPHSPPGCRASGPRSKGKVAAQWSRRHVKGQSLGSASMKEQPDLAGPTRRERWRCPGP